MLNFVFIFFRSKHIKIQCLFIDIELDTQTANFWGNPLHRPTKRCVTVKRLKMMKNEKGNNLPSVWLSCCPVLGSMLVGQRLLCVCILFQIASSHSCFRFFIFFILLSFVFFVCFWSDHGLMKLLFQAQAAGN